MNKIISINLCGIIFQIDESAYESIKQYLNEIKNNLGQSEGSFEIYQDIEGRVAELFQLKINSGKQAILPTDVTEVQALIGTPESFKEWSGSGKPNMDGQNFKPIRRIYRNADDRVLGGVCSGLAYYFGVDPLIIRLAYAGLIFAFGVGILFYFILWIAIPKANTMEEKMSMMGKPFDFGRFNSSVKDEAKAVGNNFKQMAGEFKNAAPSSSHVLNRLGSILIKIFAFFVILFGVIIFLPISIGVLAVILAFGVTLPILSSMLFINASHGVIAFLGLLFFFLTPLLWLVIKFVQMIFKTRPLSRTFKMGLLILWVVGLGMLAFVMGKLFNDFSYTSTKTDLMALHVPAGKILLIKSTNEDNSNSNFGYQNFHFVYNGNNFSGQDIMDTFTVLNTTLQLVASGDSSTQLRINKVAQGSDQSTANSRIAKMNYNFYQNDSVITLPNRFSYTSNQLWRNQHIRLQLQIPVGTKVRFDSSVGDEFLKNSSFRMKDDGDKDLQNKVWQMSEHGLIPIE